MRISTIGYEGVSLLDFIAVLAHTGVDLLVDVRDLPSSRRPGFSKTALSTALNDAGIEYVHHKVLGDPREGRLAARSGKMSQFERIFRSHIANPLARSTMKDLVQKSRTKHICLMCYERDHRNCHRHLLIQEMLELDSFKVVNLGVPIGFSCQAA